MYDVRSYEEGSSAKEDEAQKESGVLEAEEGADEGADGDEGEAVTNDADAVALEEMDETDLAHGKQPESWAQAPLVIADPFIVAKVCSASSPPLFLNQLKLVYSIFLKIERDGERPSTGYRALRSGVSSISKPPDERC